MNNSFNDLEQAFLNAHRGLPETVAYYTELRESILLFLTPYHPEIEGVHQIGNDSNLTFIVWQINGEPVIPIFTSYARAEEALKAAGKWQEKNGVAEMLGKELLHLISLLQNGSKAAINPGCATGSRVMDPETIQSVVDGSALVIPTPGELAMNGLCLSLPRNSSQPLRLREPLSRFFSTLPEVKAAWMFYEEKPKKPYEKVYVVGIEVADDKAESLKAETALALAGACPTEWNSRVIIMDAKDPGFVDVMRIPPFYKTADFQPPPKPSAGGTASSGQSK